MGKTRKIYNEITHKHLILPEKCERIVSFSPAVTEALFAMGLGDCVHGVSVYCVHPKEAREKKIIGAYNTFKEKVIDEINPDIIFTTTGYQLELIKKLMDKYPVYPIRLPPSISELIANCVEVGLVAGYFNQARELQTKLLIELAKLKNHSNLHSKRIYIEIDLGGPVTFGAYSYITDGINFLGGENIFGDEHHEWLVPNNQKVSELNPDIIIYEPKMFSKDRDRERIKANLIQRFGKVKALREDKLFVTPGIYDFFAHHGPGFILRAMKWLIENIE